ncbi:MAG TPA: apolipoprotein N-acyltransferase, partial [Nitrospiria bacterium]|nr:apolipoprotein N-acyltransferase [Nitrospiria bacterium]
TRRRSGAWQVALFFLLLAGTLLYGKARLSEEMIDPTREVGVGVVQGNINQDQIWDERFREKTLGIYERLSHHLLGETRGTRLLIWPESAAPFFFQQEGIDREKVVRLAQEEGTYLLFGSPSVAFSGSGPVLYNSAYFLSPRGTTLTRYDKMHLVPFGEYVPLSHVLFFVNKMVEGIGDFQSGTDYALMTLPDVSFGTVICFEVIFPELVRKFVDLGAGFMTTLTNDAWFGDSAAPYQHFSMVVFRAVENRVPFVRAANTGISGFIDPYGRILRQSPLFKESAFARMIHPGSVRTFYTRRGDLFGWGSIICVIMMLCAGAVVKTTRKEGIRR